MTDLQTLIDEYAAGAEILAASLKGVDDAQADARPIEGKWSIREVVSHLSDSEIVYADRMKRVLAEENPLFFEADPEQFRQSLFFEKRELKTELNVVSIIRAHMTPLLRSVDESDFKRVGRHSLDGPMTLATLLERITKHIPHHVRFIDEKIAAMNS